MLILQPKSVPLQPGAFRGRPTVNKKNPFGRSAFDAYLFSAGPDRLVNLGSARFAPATFSGHPRMVGSIGGVGGVANGTDYFTIDPTFVDQVGSVSWWWRVRFVPLSWPGAFTAIADTSNGSIRLFCGTSGAASFGSGPGGITFAGTYPVGKVCEIMFCGLAGGSAANVYANGLVASTGTWGSGHISGPLVLGENASGGGVSPNCIYLEYSAGLTFFPSAAQALSIYKNPAQLYSYRTRKRVGNIASRGALIPVYTDGGLNQQMSGGMRN